MSARRALFMLAFVLGPTTSANAVDVSFNGFGDVRLFVPPSDGSYLAGDLGKLRFGYDDGGTSAQFVQVIGEGRVQIVPEIVASATARGDPHYGPALDLLEAWGLYRPLSTSQWR